MYKDATGQEYVVLTAKESPYDEEDVFLTTISADDEGVYRSAVDPEPVTSAVDPVPVPSVVEPAPVTSAVDPVPVPPVVEPAPVQPIVKDYGTLIEYKFEDVTVLLGNIDCRLHMEPIVVRKEVFAKMTEYNGIFGPIRMSAFLSEKVANDTETFPVPDSVSIKKKFAGWEKEESRPLTQLLAVLEDEIKATWECDATPKTVLAKIFASGKRHRDSKGLKSAFIRSVLSKCSAMMAGVIDQEASAGASDEPPTKKAKTVDLTDD